MIPAIRVSTSRNGEDARGRRSPSGRAPRRRRRTSTISTAGPTSEATASSIRRSRLSSVDDTAAGRVSSAIDGCSTARPAAAYSGIRPKVASGSRSPRTITRLYPTSATVIARMPTPSSRVATRRRLDVVSSRISRARQSRSPSGKASAIHRSVVVRSTSRRCGAIAYAQASSVTPEMMVSASSSAAAVPGAAGAVPHEQQQHQREQRVRGEHEPTGRPGGSAGRSTGRCPTTDSVSVPASRRHGSGRAGLWRRTPSPIASSTATPAPRRTGFCQAGDQPEHHAEHDHPRAEKRGCQPVSASCSLRPQRSCCFRRWSHP